MHILPSFLIAVCLLAIAAVSSAKVRRVDVTCHLNHVADPPYNGTCHLSEGREMCLWQVPLYLSFETPSKKVCDNATYTVLCTSMQHTPQKCHAQYARKTTRTCTLASSDTCTVVDMDHREKIELAFLVIALVLVAMAFVLCIVCLACKCRRYYRTL